MRDEQENDREQTEVHDVGQYDNEDTE